MNEYIKSDLYRYYGKTNISTFLRGYLTNYGFRYTMWIRIAQSKSIFSFIGKIINRIKIKSPIKIHYKTQIGYGLYIGHGGPIIINPNTKIGNNCNFGQFTSIGTNSGKGATIGDNVYVGPNVCIIENVNIGNNATIGAASVVTKDIPENATVVGNYAKVINYNNPGRFINNRWIIDRKK